MSESQKTPDQGWRFQRSSSGEDTTDDPSSENEPLFTFELPDAFTNNVTTILMMSATVVLFMGYLAFGAGRSSGPRYDIPGGQVQPLSEADVTSWIQVTNDLRGQIADQNAPAVRSGTLFSYFGELNERSKLKALVQTLCREREVEFEEYRKWTQDIAHTYPFQQMDKRGFELDDLEGTPSSEADASSRRSALRANREMVYNHLDSLKTCWNKLMAASEERRAQERESKKKERPDEEFVK